MLEKYDKIWKKVNVKKEFDSEFVYSEKYLKDILGKSTQIFTIIKYQKKVLNLYVYQ